MIRVKGPSFTIRYSAFAINSKISIDGWDSLRETEYYVEAIHGYYNAEKMLSHVVKPERLSYVTSVEQALKKLLSGRTDIFIHLDQHVKKVLNTPAFKDTRITELGVMQELETYPFLHKKHVHLAPKLAAVLQQMKAEGLFERYWEQTMSQ